MNQGHFIDYIRKHFPTSSTDDIAKHLNLSSFQVRTIAKRNNIVKCEKYKQQLKENLIKRRRQWYEANIPKFEPNHLQEQIIFGSLLGDGYISKGAKRSINYYYQEHFGESQREYRIWKLSKLKNLGFTINGNYLRSKSHPYFTNLYPLLYPNGIKSLTSSFLSKCNHPIFITTLYLDDGSLNFSYHYNKEKNTLYCHPSIQLYTLNLTRNENVSLAEHLNQTFNTNFSISSHPDGNKSLLKLNKEIDVRYFLNLIKPYVQEIPSMKYKTCLEEKIRLYNNKIKERYGKEVIIKISSSSRRNPYSTLELNTIIQMKRSGYKDKEIASKLGRTYWSVIYKMSELRKKGLL